MHSVPQDLENSLDTCLTAVIDVAVSDSLISCRYVDALVLAAYFAPCGVAKADVAIMPIVGTITRGLQFLFVARTGTTGKSDLHTSKASRFFEHSCHVVREPGMAQHRICRSCSTLHVGAAAET